MRFRPLAALALGLTATGVAWSQPDPGYIEQKRRMATLHVTGLLDNWLAATGVPGAVVAVVEGSHTLALEGFGLADIGRGTAVDPAKTVFRVGDLVRSMTVTAALQLAERGALGLDSDIFHRSGLEFLTHDSFGPLTPAQLLLHTAGIDHRIVATRARTPDDVMTLGTYLEQRMPPRIRPGGVVSIPSIHGYALVGRLIEVASGETFDSYLEGALFAPLGMSKTAVAPSTLPLDQIAKGYRRRERQWTVVSPDYPQTIPASTLLTTAADMTKWLRAILAGGSLKGRQILDTTSIERLLERQFAHHESLPGRTLAFKEGRHFSPRELYLASTDNGFSAVMVLLPHRQVGLFAAFNGEIDFWGLVYQILDPFDSPGSSEPAAFELAEISPGNGLSGFWQDATVSQVTAEKLVSLVRQDRIQTAADGALLWRSKTFVPAGPQCFEEQHALTRLCFVDGPNQMRFAAIGDLVLEKLSWYATRPVQITLWIAFTALFLAAGWPRAPLPNRQSSLRPDDAFSPRWPGSLARLAATFHFVFMASLAVVLATNLRIGTPTLLYEIPASYLVVLSLPLVAAALTLVAAAGLGPVWRSSRSTLGYRLRLTVLILALLAFLPFLRSWNLLGFRI